MTISPEARIHAAAVVEPGAVIGAGCVIGPFALIGPEVVLAPGVEVKSHAVVTGWTEIGEGTVVFPFACVGEVPQDLKFKGERTRLIAQLTEEAAADAADPQVQAWEALMWTFQQALPWAAPGEKWVACERIYALSDQP